MDPEETPRRSARRRRPRLHTSLRQACGLLSVCGLLLACQSSAPHRPPPAVVEDLDIERYMGLWYEIASYPQFFQRGCVATRARYSLRPDGRIRVLNRCRDGSFDGELREAEGVAWVADPAVSNARLFVSFFWPFKGHYWVIDLGEDYEYAVVGHPERKYLWILSRTPTLPEAVLSRILGRLEARGIDLDRLEWTPQPAAESGVPASRPGAAGGATPPSRPSRSAPDEDPREPEGPEAA